jgi:hypothetical protein
MFKNIALLKRKPGMSREDFIAYYETKHAPLILSLMPEIVRYQRNFLVEGNRYIFDKAAPIDFDVVTEVWLADRAAYERFAAENAKPDVAAKIAADEENLFDRQYTRMFVVEEKFSSI